MWSIAVADFLGILTPSLDARSCLERAFLGGWVSKLSSTLTMLLTEPNFSGALRETEILADSLKTGSLPVKFGLDSCIVSSALTDEIEPCFLGGGVTKLPLLSTKLLIMAVEPCLDVMQGCFLAGRVSVLPSTLTRLLAEPNFSGALRETKKLVDS